MFCWIWTTRFGLTEICFQHIPHCKANCFCVFVVNWFSASTGWQRSKLPPRMVLVRWLRFPHQHKQDSSFLLSKSTIFLRRANSVYSAADSNSIFCSSAVIGRGKGKGETLHFWKTRCIRSLMTKGDKDKSSITVRRTEMRACMVRFTTRCVAKPFFFTSQVEPHNFRRLVEM